jgi:hypothetical protein
MLQYLLNFNSLNQTRFRRLAEMGLSTGWCRAVMSVEAGSDGLAGSSVQARASTSTEY